VNSERYLLTCMRYIEDNPVRAAMVALRKLVGTPFVRTRLQEIMHTAWLAMFAGASKK
jgi:hypothetical protein